MNRIYRVTIHGRTLEDSDLRSLLKRAVQEKRAHPLATSTENKLIPVSEETADGLEPATSPFLGPER